MKTPRTFLESCGYLGKTALCGFISAYAALIKPRSTDEDAKRRELILNITLITVIAASSLLEISVIYTGDLSFLIIIAFLVSLLILSRKGHHDLASYLFVGLIFMATTYGIYAWGITLPISMLSYSAVIVISSILLGTRIGLAAACLISASLIILGWMETHGIIQTDLSWSARPMTFKDMMEDALLYMAIVAVSWLSNREIARSLDRARGGEKALAAERDSLEIKFEERTKELKAAQMEKVNQLYRFSEFGRLASGVFHDLANPLSVVSISVEKLRDSGDATYDEAREHIDRAIRASKRMEAFVQTVKKQLHSDGDKRDFIACEEVEDAIDLLIHKSRTKGVEIRFSAPEKICLHGDPVKFFQVAVNLISNAIDSYGDTQSKAPIEVSLTATVEEACLTVQDHGSGVPLELHSTIFEPFFTTKPRAEGTGLGLSTTKTIVETDFGGHIELNSSPGNGSTFRIILPLSRENKAKDQQTRSRALGSSL